jgi:ribose 5-phosphate isomerase B
VDRLFERRPDTKLGVAGAWCWSNPSCDFLYRGMGFAGSNRLESLTMMIAVGCDHGGVELKNFLIGVLRARGTEVQDFGTHGRESVDYPDFGRVVSQLVSAGDAERGLLICTSGIGMSILANKFPGVRAALVQDLDGARSSREHNNANILVLSGAKTERFLAQQIVEAWLSTPFAGGRHQRRIDKISQIEFDIGARKSAKLRD